MAAAVGAGGVPHLPPLVIEENSGIRKAIAYIPVVGEIVSYAQEASLETKIFSTTSVPRLVELISVKNDYKIANAVRSVVTVAAIIATVSFVIFSDAAFSSLIIPTIPLCLFLLARAADNNWGIGRNNSVIGTLSSRGYTPDTRCEIH